MLTVDQLENQYLVSFYNVSKLNVLNSKEIESKLLPLVSQKNTNLVLNFSGVNFIDSSGLEILLNLYKHSKINNTDFNLINLSEDLKGLLQLLELDQVFQLN